MKPTTSDNVFDIAQYRQQQNQNETIGVGKESYELEVLKRPPDKASEDVLPIDRLYPIRPEFTKPLASVMALLKEALGRCEQAIEAERDGNVLAADDKIQSIQLLMPDLFFFREYSEGVGYLSLAIFHALKNKQGMPFSEAEMLSIRFVLLRGISDPFLPFQKAIEATQAMEEAGLVVEPPEIGGLAERA